MYWQGSLEFWAHNYFNEGYFPTYLWTYMYRLMIYLFSTPNVCQKLWKNVWNLITPHNIIMTNTYVTFTHWLYHISCVVQCTLSKSNLGARFTPLIVFILWASKCRWLRHLDTTCTGYLHLWETQKQNKKRSLQQNGKLTSTTRNTVLRGIYTTAIKKWSKKVQTYM